MLVTLPRQHDGFDTCPEAETLPPAQKRAHSQTGRTGGNANAVHIYRQITEHAGRRGAIAHEGALLDRLAIIGSQGQPVLRRERHDAPPLHKDDGAALRDQRVGPLAQNRGEGLFELLTRAAMGSLLL
jgi:hypothetical protein